MKKLLLLLAQLIPLLLNAQDGYKIQVHIEQCDSNTLYWGYYYGSETNIIKLDSFQTSAPIFNTTIQKTNAIPGGMYVLYFKDKLNPLEVIVHNGDEFSLSFNKPKPLESATIKGSEENSAFVKCNAGNQANVLELRYAKQQIQSANNRMDSLNAYKDYNDILKKIEDNHLVFEKKFPLSIATSFFKLNDAYKFFNVETYWDTFPFDDKRIVFTPIVDKLLTQLFKLLPEQSSALIPKLDAFLTNANDNKNLLKYGLWWLSNKLEAKNNTQLELVYLHILENYYLNGKAFWLDNTTMFPYKSAAASIRKIMLGAIAPEISLPDINEKEQSLRAFCKKNKYTVLIMWSPNCPHCKKQLPIVDSTLSALNPKVSIKAFAIQNDQDDATWKEVITTKHLNNSNWIHLHDPLQKGVFRELYETYSNPRMFLLDNNMKVLEKYITGSNLKKTVEAIEVQ